MTRFRLAIIPIIACFVVCGGVLQAGTTVNFGSVSQFSGPDDPGLDLEGDLVYAVNFSANDGAMSVNGITFTPDTQSIPGATFVGPNNVTPWQTRPEFGNSIDDNNLEEILHDIRWANSGAVQSLQANLNVTAGIEYKLQLFISGNHAESRNWDISVDGVQCVDEISSNGFMPGAGYSQSESTVFSYEFVAPDSQVNVVMGNLFGLNDGGDRNPIWQALTLERVTIPPTPESLSLTPREFFAVQSEPVGSLETVDLKSGATHLYSLVAGAGNTDNAKFEIEDETLIKAPHDFGSDPVGTTYDVRVRTTDAEDPARFLEETFTLTLAQPLAPTDLDFSATSASAGAIVGTPIGQLTAIDPSPVDAHVFSLVAGAGDADNGRFEIDGDTVRLAQPLPGGGFNVSFRVRATDLSGLTYEEAFTLDITDPSLRINEVMASNGSTLNDEDGDASDWIELFNEQAQTVNLNGWYLTDDADDLTKWQFPAVTLGANAYLVVFASGKDRAPTNGDNLHTNFQLGSGGEFIALVEPDGATIASQIDFADQFTDVAYGSDPAGTQLGFLQSPTPGAANSALALNVLNEVTFSHERGFYDAAFSLELAPTIKGSTIRYTTNGTKPTPSSGSIYSGPIPITPETAGSTKGTRRVRAIAVNPTAAIAPVATHTYLFINGAGANPTTDGVVGQTVLRTNITNHATYGPLIDDGLLALPTVSIVRSGGVSASETETSMEFFDPTGAEPGFQIDCGIKIVGGASVGSAKNNWRLYFRSEYGAPKLRYPLYANHPYSTDTDNDEFDVLQLRGGSHDNFYWMANPGNQSNGAYRPGDAQYIRNRWISDVEMIMGHTSLHGRYVQCYLNGVYHGLYHLHERPMHHYMDKDFGGDPDDYHYTNSGRTGSDHGGGDNWSSTWQQQVKPAASAGGQQSRDWINWEVLADNQLLYYYAGNAWDWSSQHNWMAAGPKDPGEGGWRFYSWDCDVMIYDVTANNLGSGAPDGVFAAMMNDVDFRVFFRDRICKHCFHDGILRPNGLRESYDYRMNEIFTAIVPETARWQGAAISPPWDRDDEWTNEWGYMTNTYWPLRTAILMNQFRARANWWPVEPPEFDQRGGHVPPNYTPELSSPTGTIYFTTDGSDPRMPGGAVNPDALPFNDGTSDQTRTVLPTGSEWKYLDDGSDQGTTWKETGFDDSGWAAGNAELGYGDGDEATVLSFGFNPGDKHITTYFRKSFDSGDVSMVNGLILRLRRDDGAVVYLNGTEVWRANMPATGAITSETGSSTAIGGADESTLFTKNDVDPALLLADNNVIAVEIHQSNGQSSDISFDFQLDVTEPSDPTDPSQLVLTKSTRVRARVLDGGNWSAINEAYFYIGDQADATNLVVSEIHYRPDPPTAAEDPGGLYSRTDFEYVELENISANRIHFDGVRFIEGIDFDFEDTILLDLPPGGRLLLVESRDAFLTRYPGLEAAIAGEYSGNLNNGGEQLLLVGPADAVIRDFVFDDDHPWPASADGDGFSLTLVAPTTNPDHSDPFSWRPSVAVGGSPNDTDAVPFSGDPADLLVYAFGADNEQSAASAPVSGIDGDGHLTISFPRNLAADDVAFAVEFSDDLETWLASGEYVAQVNHGNGKAAQLWRAAQPMPAGGRQYVRVKATSR